MLGEEADHHRVALEHACTHAAALDGEVDQTAVEQDLARLGSAGASASAASTRLEPGHVGLDDGEDDLVLGRNWW